MSVDFVLLSKSGIPQPGLNSPFFPDTLLGTDNFPSGFDCCCACDIPVEWRILELSYPYFYQSGPIVLRGEQDSSDDRPDGPTVDHDESEEESPSYFLEGLPCCFYPPYFLYTGFMELQAKCINPITGEFKGWHTLDEWTTVYGEPVHCFAESFENPCCTGTGRLYSPARCTQTPTEFPPTTPSGETTPDPSGTDVPPNTTPTLIPDPPTGTPIPGRPPFPPPPPGGTWTGTVWPTTTINPTGTLPEPPTTTTTTTTTTKPPFTTDETGYPPYP
jgi:hypothetical protein